MVCGRQNQLAYNALDRNLSLGRGDKRAFIWEGEDGEVRTYTYAELLREVKKRPTCCALGVQAGDRVTMYLPLIPEAAFSMLACARIGAVHSVVFGGFSGSALSDRINDAQSKLLITADAGYRKGAPVPLKANADTAAQNMPTLEHMLVVWRTDCGTHDARRPRRVVARARWRGPVTSTKQPRWTASIRFLSCTPPAVRASPKAFCTRPAAIWSPRT